MCVCVCVCPCVVLKGAHLLRGVGVADYSVQIENIKCTITQLTDSSLLFRPPSADLPQTIKGQCPTAFPYPILVSYVIITSYHAAIILIVVTIARHTADYAS